MIGDVIVVGVVVGDVVVGDVVVGDVVVGDREAGDKLVSDKVDPATDGTYTRVAMSTARQTEIFRFFMSKAMDETQPLSDATRGQGFQVPHGTSGKLIILSRPCCMNRCHEMVDDDESCCKQGIAFG